MPRESACGIVASSSLETMTQSDGYEKDNFSYAEVYIVRSVEGDVVGVETCA